MLIKYDDSRNDYIFVSVVRQYLDVSGGRYLMGKKHTGKVKVNDWGVVYNDLTKVNTLTIRLESYRVRKIIFIHKNYNAKQITSFLTHLNVLKTQPGFPIENEPLLIILTELLDQFGFLD